MYDSMFLYYYRILYVDHIECTIRILHSNFKTLQMHSNILMIITDSVNTK